MKGKFIKLIIVALVFTIALSACTADNPVVDSPDLEDQIKEKDARITELEGVIKKFEENNGPNQISNHLLSTVIDVLESLKNKDMNKLSSFVHPSLGLRFTPYEHVDLQNDKVFTAEVVKGLGSDAQVYTWGNYDGTGDPMELKFEDYYNKYIYDEDFINPQIIGNNVAVGKGNSINNIETAYPKGHFVELHFTGFEPQYAGIDWKSLRLVFEDVKGTWYLVGIVHGQWTI